MIFITHFTKNAQTLFIYHGKHYQVKQTSAARRVRLIDSKTTYNLGELRERERSIQLPKTGI